MKRSTAIRHLVEMGTVATESIALREMQNGWPLVEIWLTGELLEPGGDLDAGSVILMLDTVPAETTWLAMHPDGEWVGDRLRLGKRPMLWCYRPSTWPPWNARYQRVARIWSDASGLDGPAIDLLRSNRSPQIIQPSADEFRKQLVEERRASFEHLRKIVDGYWEPQHRRRGADRHAGEDHLWRAAAGLIEIEDALT